MKGLGLVRLLWITAGPNGHKVLLLELGGKNQGPRRHGGVHRGNSVIPELQEAGGSWESKGKALSTIFRGQGALLPPGSAPHDPFYRSFKKFIFPLVNVCVLCLLVCVCV